MPKSTNLETVERVYEFLSDPERIGDPQIRELFDPEVEIQQSASLLGTEGTFHGYEGLARSAREAFAVFRDLRWIPLSFEESGDEIVAYVETRGFGKASGVEIRAPVVHTWALRDGLIVRWHVRINHADPENS
jgi:ketosteroid isomerase-like protein